METVALVISKPRIDRIKFNCNCGRENKMELLSSESAQVDGKYLMKPSLVCYCGRLWTYELDGSLRSDRRVCGRCHKDSKLYWSPGLADESGKILPGMNQKDWYCRECTIFLWKSSKKHIDREMKSLEADTNAMMEQKISFNGFHVIRRKGVKPCQKSTRRKS